MRTARLLAAAAATIGVFYAVYFFLGPTGMMCSITDGGPQVCRPTTQLEMSGLAPLPFFILWAGAPVAALAALTWGSRATATRVLVAAILVDLTSIVSIGGGFYYALFCVPLLMLALVAMRRAPA
ncbi:MAG TPA: hypothetical protein VFM93_10210 [Candidatus Limnocylindria bacterium]|nr:hypothetical protein [Candidatus Limnocylindria bacterium]